MNINLQSNLTIGEGLDGYDDSPVKFKNSSPDIYNYYSVGIKYHFGPVGISKKKPLLAHDFNETFNYSINATDGNGNFSTDDAV